jgi:hypothetical protein
MRELQIPLAEIRAILALEPVAAGQRVADYWTAAESEHAARRELAAYLVDRLRGKGSVMYEVKTRAIPNRSLLCLKRNVAGQDGAWALGKECVALLRQHDTSSRRSKAGHARRSVRS